mgnify:CR=1 FL=1
MAQSPNIIIIGAGLTGLTLAYQLKNKGLIATVIEARPRLGGRMLTDYQTDRAPLELGATWLGQKHQQLNQLLSTLKLGVFEQHIGPRAIYEPISTSPPQLAQLPPNEEPSYRIQGGSAQLIQTLIAQLDQDQVQLNEMVEAIQDETAQLLVTTSKGNYSADYVISTLPPKLLFSKVQLPILPSELRDLALNTHTWMGESIKVGLRYSKPFWRSAQTSGTIFSNVGPVSEMYDHADYEDQTYALKGFMNGSYHSATPEFRRNLILKQLERYFGAVVHDYLSYEEKVWSQAVYTFVPYDGYILPHQNNGHPVFRKPYLDGRFFVAGSETAQHHPGYMDGAVGSANWVASQLVK